MKVEKGTVVSMDYELRLADGEVVDASQPGSPLTYIHGEGQIIGGLERALEGLSAGDEKKVVVPAADGYGEYDPAGLREVPRSLFPPNFQPRVGQKLAFQGPHGRIPVVVKEVRPEAVVIDHNHPLAGKELHFSVNVREVRAATPQELKGGGHVCTGCGKH